MIRSSLLVAVCVASSLSPALAEETLHEIIAKNIEAMGGKAAMDAAKAMRMTGTMAMGGGMEAPFTVETKRPMKMRLEFVFQGMTGIQAYDGEQGWMVMPFLGKTEPELMTGDDLKNAEEQADFDGPLVDYEKKGNTVELLGLEEVEGTEAIKLKVTLKNGDIRYIYLDSEAYIEIKAEGKRMVRGTEREFETSFGDYKEVAGMMLPHVIASSAKGSPQQQTITIEKIEVNPELDDSRFAMPVPEPATEEAK